MPIHIYRGGSNPGPQNPLLRLLISVAVLAGLIGLGVLLLPVIGAVALIILGIIVFMLIAGFVYRLIYGDPLQRMREMNEGVRINPQSSNPFGSRPQEQPKQQTPRAFKGRPQDVEDAVVVEERQRTDK